MYGNPKTSQNSLGSSEDLEGDQIISGLVFDSSKREILYAHDPETININAELRQEEAEVRKQEKESAKRLCNLIKSKLSERQIKIWILRSQGRTFAEITALVKCSRATVFNDWKVIREVASSVSGADVSDMDV